MYWYIILYIYIIYWYIILYIYKSILCIIGILYYININQFYVLVYYTIYI